MNERNNYTKIIPASDPAADAIANEFNSMVQGLPSSRPMVGCIVPAYNEADSIGGVLESLLAQTRLPDVIHVVVNNSYLGLIRQAQRGFDMDYQVQLSFENVNAPELGVYGVDHVAVAEGLGCKAIRVRNPDEAPAAFAKARDLIREFKVPVVVEFILEQVTNIAMGTEIDNIVEFEEIIDLPINDAAAPIVTESVQS